MSELKPCPFCGGDAQIDRMGTNKVSMQISCGYCGAYMESGENWIDENSNWNQRVETETEKRLTADMNSAISLMSPSWQHAAEKEPDLMTRYVTMAENQFKKKNEEIARLTAIATKHATRADELYEKLEQVIYCSDNNTGHEPSLSCFQRAIDEAREALSKSRIEQENKQ